MPVVKIDEKTISFFTSTVFKAFNDEDLEARWNAFSIATPDGVVNVEGVGPINEILVVKNILNSGKVEWEFIARGKHAELRRGAGGLSKLLEGDSKSVPIGKIVLGVILKMDSEALVEKQHSVTKKRQARKSKIPMTKEFEF